MSELNTRQITADTYVEWANNLDSTGKDSTEARERLKDITTLTLLRNNITSIRHTTGQFSDMLKKWIFYGKPNDNLPTPSGGARGLTDFEYDSVKVAFTGPDAHNMVRILHAFLGLASELPEIAVILEAYLFEDSPLDMTALADECGDFMWYLALFAKGCGFMTFDEFMIGNYAKLTERYGTEWSQQAVLNKDPEIERERLEAYIATYVPRAHIPNKAWYDKYGPKDQDLEAVEKFPTLNSIVSELSACLYHSRSGSSIENNPAFKALRHYAFTQDVASRTPVDDTQSEVGDIDDQQTSIG